MKYKKIIITGVGGFIGSSFTRECLKRGYIITGVDSMTYASNWNHITEFEQNPNFKFIFGDINNIYKIEDCDLIINIAAESHVDRSIDNCKDFIHSNINGVHNLLELIKGTKIPLIQISTDEIYGDIEEGSHKETDNLNPSNPYAATKSSADLLIQSYARTYGIKYNIIRLTNNYGKDQHLEKLIPKTINHLKHGKKIPLHNQGTPLRNWLHVDDSVEAILTVIEKGKLNEIYNVNGNYELENKTVVSEIIKIYKKEDNIELNDYVDYSCSRPGQDVRYSLDDTKLRELGWYTKVKFVDKLREIVEFHLDN